MTTPTAPCPLCGFEIPTDSYYCTQCKQNLPTDAKGRPAFNASETLNGSLYCTACGTVAIPKRYTKGSFGMEILLWLLMVLPGVLYTLWRITSKYAGCPQCQAPGMIPLTSPVAQAALKQRPFQPTGGDGSSRDRRRKCPYCAELVLAEATVCKHCRSELPPAIVEKYKATLR